MRPLGNGKRYSQAQRKGQSYILLAFGCLVSTSAILNETRGKNFVVDSGASMHMLSRNDQNLAELETVRASSNPTAAITANGEVQTNEEATVYENDVDLFATSSRLRQQCYRLENSAKTTEIPTSGPVVTSHILSKAAEKTMQHGELRACCSGLVNRTFHLIYECFLNIGIAGLNAR